ncbi:Precorrin-2 C(20)-methyltransferase [Candidatus Johnevansia muelleri]|uniref:Precorrin-2 C(20)-methyltransferase n=1 Tax=Candidatus Johnevansia muelleri TaxID=1495769 RepID=A0A078KHC1_9GAMM|nr:Precorrin-2 C(20)-methyltransferase [Candidatus Evansia muelleri]
MGVGVGPGDPELLTFKAVKALQKADILCFFSKSGNRSYARDIVAENLPSALIEVPFEYPLTIEINRHHPNYRRIISNFYDIKAEIIAKHLMAGRNVVVLSEGDPLFFGSYMHLHIRLAHRFKTKVIPGITGMSGAWSDVMIPICQGDDILSILPGTLDEITMKKKLFNCEAAVIMKIGNNLYNIRKSLKATGLINKAIYVENATMDKAISKKLIDKIDDIAPYFSIILVPGCKI